MTRILRLLLIAAVAWPIWQSAAAQEVKLKAEKDAESVGLTNLIDVLDVTSDIALPLDKGALKQDVNQVNSKDIDNVDKQFKIVFLLIVKQCFINGNNFIFGS